MEYKILKGTYTRGRIDKGSEAIVGTLRTLQEAVDFCDNEVRKYERFHVNDAKLLYRHLEIRNGEKKTIAYMVIGIGSFLAIPKDIRVMPREIEDLWD